MTAPDRIFHLIRLRRSVAYGVLLVAWHLAIALTPMHAADSPSRKVRENRRILYNLDGDSCMTLRAGRKGPGPIAASDMTNLVAELTQPGSQVDTLLVCINAQVLYYPTRVGTLRGAASTPDERAKWSAHERQRFENLKAFYNSGQDPYAILIGEARRRGLESLLTFRMNDAHGNDFLRTAFWQQHPEFRLGNGALDFSHDAVRDYVFQLIAEAIQRYDCDGLELDFQRFPTFFKGGAAPENIERMNQLVQRVRQQLNEEGARRGRRLVLSVRAPSNYGAGRPTYETSIDSTRGCDVAAWAREGWIDFLTVSEWLFAADTLDLKSWRRHVPGIPIYAGIQPESRPSPEGAHCMFCIGADGYRQLARERWADGADGIYLFNFFTSREWSESLEPPFEVLTQIGDVATISAAQTPSTRPIRLDSPTDFQVFQRATATQGFIRLRGELANNPQPSDRLESRIYGRGNEFEWQQLPALNPNSRRFDFPLKSAAGGWFRVDIRLRRGDETLAEISIPHVGVGEVFVVAGQSNSANHGETRQQTQSALVAAFTGTTWQLAHDPQPGASGGGGSFIPPFGDAISREFQVPIGIVASGAGGTSIREWLPAGERFPNPPTILARVQQLSSGGWSSDGALFNGLIQKVKTFEPFGFRAVLWHQGESDANQADPSRTLPGALYQKYLTQLVLDCRREAGWSMPWFVAQATYHTPQDPGSDDIRSAQAALWKSSIALEGPDTDALAGEWRDGNGQGVHFSDKGLREHGARWAQKVIPWLHQQLASPAPPHSSTYIEGPTPRLELPGTERWTLNGHATFLFLPAPSRRTSPQPWILYAPTLPGYPDGAERWMHERFLEAGIAVAGIDVGEAYGSPESHPALNQLYDHLVNDRGFATKACVFGRSRGGLWVSSWAAQHTNRVAGLIGIYPVFDFRTYPGLKNAAPAYKLSPAELEARIDTLNPISQIPTLARARIPAALIHGDVDTVVPLRENSEQFLRHYQNAGAESLVQLLVLRGQGHNFHRGFFQAPELVHFAIERARAGARPSTP